VGAGSNGFVGKGVLVGDEVSEITSDIAGSVDVGEIGVSVSPATQPVSNIISLSETD
jgi:hypothetical protein